MKKMATKSKSILEAESEAKATHNDQLLGQCRVSVQHCYKARTFLWEIQGEYCNWDLIYTAI